MFFQDSLRDIIIPPRVHSEGSEKLNIKATIKKYFLAGQKGCLYSCSNRMLLISEQNDLIW